MNAARMAAAGVLILALGAVAWIGVSYLAGSDPATAAQLAASVQEDKQSLLDGIREGRPLYFKKYDFRRDRLGPVTLPQS